MAEITSNTYVSNLNADGQASGVKLMTDERGHLYPLSHLFNGSVLGEAFKVVPDSGTRIKVSPGYIQIPFSDYAYQCWLDVESTLTLEASPQSAGTARISTIVAYVKRDIQYSESQTNNPGALIIAEVKGDESSSPTAPSDSKIQTAIHSGNPFVRLANIYIPAGTSTIAPGNITDVRQQLTVKEGVGLPNGSYATGINLGSGSSNSGKLQISVINAGDPLPGALSDTDILVCRIAQ